MLLDSTTVFAPSPTVAARMIEDEFIIVSLEHNPDERAEELFLLNETGRVVWEQLDGQKTLGRVVNEICRQYNSTAVEEIRRDIHQLVAELHHRNIIIQIKRS